MMKTAFIDLEVDGRGKILDIGGSESRAGVSFREDSGVCGLCL